MIDDTQNDNQENLEEEIPVNKNLSKKKSENAEETLESKEEKAAKKYSDKKILFVDIDDEITGLFDRIRNLKVENIYLVIPKRANILNSVVNLKILNRKLKDVNKNLFIITNDEQGVNLAMQADIPVYEKSEEDLFNKDDANKSPHLKISPISALKNFLEDDKPVRLEQRKYSIFDIVRKNKNPGLKMSKTREAPLPQSGRRKSKKTRSVKDFFVIFSFVKGYRGTLGIMILASLVLLFAVSYIALPGATIYLKPKSDVIEQSVNITLADNRVNAAELNTHPTNMIASYEVYPGGPIKKTYTYNSTGRKFYGQNANGEITIINQDKKEWPLIPKTRFQSPDGIIYRLQNRIVVPAATDQGFGTIKAFVSADETDIHGAIVGERGNIAPTTFFLPSLKPASQKLLYAKSETVMTGGKTDVKKFVTKEDLEAAKKFAHEKIIEEIIPTLDAYIKDLNDVKKSNLRLLVEQNIAWKRAIRYDDPKSFVDMKLVNKELDSFEVNAEVNATGISFNYDEFKNILKRELKSRKLPQKKLTKIDEESITYRLFNNDAGTKKYVVTASIKGIEEFELDPDKENGKRLIEKIKEHILGWNKKEAIKFIQNLDEVERVEIKTWPVWAPNIPNLENNVKVNLLEN
ncbi:MAG: hypothetical protein UR27_C0010G0046 [Candidatus Peregrinibacteria bacterium GW2011_GWA2_33_10]|nr:MAG: hypothetical protein UR27_C0010G0046 [Candidatus Peregrinibacteria bacterium GW2011_GWA2_33_10]KKP41234.1 MAG: hypothetical protein UR30_C0001G0081 [Candidatus Peregrinibacteria bacterium GW2011_GWC2_33_13]OGJ48945.1 MAG: hypothetical protein A2229_03905 [Candidatus Peregrinibacteria bacterium RIFOXYA2_FULL_33_7]